jgi:hypothetical protein
LTTADTTTTTNLAHAFALALLISGLALLAIAGGIRTLLEAANDITDQNEGNTTE